MRTTRVLIGVAVAVMLTGLVGRDWLKLAWNAWDYPTASPHARTQVAIDGQFAYVAAGVDGIEVIDLTRGQRHALHAPPALLDRIDDLAIADRWLFALDATPPGHLQVYSLNSTGLATPLGAAVPVPVGPFSGVSAAAGVVAVSGGTSQLTLRGYDTEGRLGTSIATADFGRGQPDIALRPDGALAAISTHVFGPKFGLTFAEIRRAPLRLQALGRLDVRSAGFTSGGFKPAHFPLAGRWLGDYFYLAHGGGLSTIDASDPQHPRLLAIDARPQPAMDAAVFGDTLDIVRAGAEPAIYRYHLPPVGIPVLIGIWQLPPGGLPGATASDYAHTLLALHHQGWQVLSSDAFSPPATP